ncbi:hypothetical protein ABFX02_13G177300 [Erythranthe guttata]
MRGSRRKKFQIRRLMKKTPASESPPPPPWIELPTELTLNIMNRLGVVELLESAQKVCTTWRSVCKDSSLWRVIDMKFPQHRYDMPYFNMSCDIDMCRDAVDRSRGELIDINIEYFCTDELLEHISERSSHLKRLRLACCDGISSHCFRESVKKFPELEELHLFFMPSILYEDIEAIGISCPNLKSFTFNDRGYKLPLVDVNNNYAFAIAKSMPNLHHLRLFGNRLTDEGMQAILDGCPHLESLDLRQCYKVELGGDLGKRCSDRIKYLKQRYDSTSDYEWDADVYFDENDHANPSNYDDPFGNNYVYSMGPFDDYTDPFNNDDFLFGYEEIFPIGLSDDRNPFGNDYFSDDEDFLF